MTTTEQLQRIRAKCEELLNYNNSSTHAAGWKTTIAAIDECIADDVEFQAMYDIANASLISFIIAAWEGIV